MQNSVGLLICLLVLAGCATPDTKMVGGTEKRALQIRWQRLVDEDGQTCGRCGTTEKAVNDAVKTLRRSLKPLNIDVGLQKTALSASTFSKEPLESNRIWISGKPVEEWLQATTGQSQCSGACGDSECRTVIVDGKAYETIPAELIVRAGLLASADLMQRKSRNPWNPTAEWSQGSPSCCPPSFGGKADEGSRQ